MKWENMTIFIFLVALSVIELLILHFLCADFLSFFGSLSPTAQTMSLLFYSFFTGTMHLYSSKEERTLLNFFIPLTGIAFFFSQAHSLGGFLL